MNKYEADEILNLAIMSKTPYVIVEGVNDIRIYEGIANSADVPCEIYSVDMLEGLAGGNDGVIQALGIIESLSMPTGKSVDQFVMGVIDRDARYYRGEMPELASIFSLNVYSIESHFVSKFSIKPAIDRLTRIPATTEIDVESIYSRIEGKIFDVYYFSLDALKNSVDQSYQSIVSFSSNAGRRKNETTIVELHSKKDELDAFANNLHLTSNIDSLRKFVKGKWLLIAYAEELFAEIEQLVDRCKSSSILKCRMCNFDNKAPCLFQLRDGLSKNSLYSILQDFFEVPDFDYIKNKFKLLSETATA